MNKKFLSILLALAMVFTMIPLTVSANEPQNNGTVYISISEDENFVIDENGNPVAYTPVSLEELALFNLDDWGLGDYNYDANGDGIPEITALHLYIYVHEIILGLDWSEVSVSGTPGSIFFEGGLFGYTDANLRYDVNGVYPAIDGWGLTADQIVLSDGDCVNVAHYSSWEFWGDSWSGFHYFTDSEGNLEHTYNAKPGEELTLGIVRSYSDWANNGAPAYAPREYYYVYYGSTYGVPEGRITADENGKFDISFDAAGTWYLWADGGYGMEYGTSIVSAPAFATVNVNDIHFNIDLTRYEGTLGSALILSYDLEDSDSYFLDENSIVSGKSNEFSFMSAEYDAYIIDLCSELNDESIIGWDVNGTEYLMDDADSDNDYCWELENDVIIGYNFDYGYNEFYIDLGGMDGYYTPGSWTIKPVFYSDADAYFEQENYMLLAEVETKINKIGTVTIDSKSAIEEARHAYDALTEAQKKLVANYDVLTAAETKLAEVYIEAAQVDHKSIYEATGNYINGLGTPSVGSTGGEWMVIGLTRAGYTCPEGYYKNVVEYVNSKINDKEQLHKAKSTDNSRVILALTAAGYDVTDVDGHNLLMGLTDMTYVKKQGINGPIWALIAFDCYNYDIPTNDEAVEQVTREKLIAYILEKQLEDGGWALSGQFADPDMTGMAIQALAPYYSTNAEVKAAVDKALICLSNKQYDNGGFGSIDGTCSESCAQVIVALTALGINPETDARFIKNGVSVVDAMCLFAVEGGGFAHSPEGGVNGMATEQSQYALASYFRFLDGKTSLYDMTDVKIGDDTVDTEDNNQDNSNDNSEDTNKDDENTQTPGTSGEVNSPQTGDGSNMILYFVIMLVSALGIVDVLITNKKYRISKR